MIDLSNVETCFVLPNFETCNDLSILAVSGVVSWPFFIQGHRDGFV